jgi:hypothetical protein
MSGEKPASLKENIHIILNGTASEKKNFARSYFFVADTPQFIKDLGLTGDYFSIRYGVISRHCGKDADHSLAEQDWIDLCDRITEPFAIAKHGNNYNIFTNIKTNDQWIMTGVTVKIVGRNLAANDVRTAFGYRKRQYGNVNNEFIYVAKKITPEQSAILDGTDFRQYLSVQELT